MKQKKIPIRKYKKKSRTINDSPDNFLSRLFSNSFFCFKQQKLSDDLRSIIAQAQNWNGRQKKKKS